MAFFWIVELLARLCLSFKTVILVRGSYHILWQTRMQIGLLLVGVFIEKLENMAMN